MTTIATDGEVMAGDTLASQGQSCTYIKSKVFKIKGWLVGYGGTLVDCEKTIQSMKTSRLSPKAYLDTYQVPAPVTLLLVDPEGRIFEYEHGVSIRIPASCHAIGGGADVALGAMYVGAGPVKAIQAAKHYNSSTDGKVTKRTL